MSSIGAVFTKLLWEISAKLPIDTSFPAVPPVIPTLPPTAFPEISKLFAVILSTFRLPAVIFPAFKLLTVTWLASIVPVVILLPLILVTLFVIASCTLDAPNVVKPLSFVKSDTFLPLIDIRAAAIVPVCITLPFIEVTFSFTCDAIIGLKFVLPSVRVLDPLKVTRPLNPIAWVTVPKLNVWLPPKLDSVVTLLFLLLQF